MFDPLNSASAFGGSVDTPPWPTTPHPNSPIPNLRRASTPVPPTPDKGPSPGLYGKEPQIYGQPEAGLISPRDTVGSNGTKYEKTEPYLRVRITGLDRNRRDILIRLDAQANLSNFTGTTYRNVSRSYLEFQQFYDSIVHSNPQTIVPALPLAQTSAPTDEEDDRLVRIMLQRWITRVCEDPILLHDEDLRSFIESDFGYQPTPRPRRKTSSGFGLMRRGVPDEDEELQRARFELTKLEGQFFDTAKAVDKLAVARKSLVTAHSEMGHKLINVATTEAHPPLGNALRKLGRTWHSLADLDQAQALSECVILGDSLGYQGMNARSAKETLQMRTGVLEEYQAAVKTTISKRRQIERLKASSNIRPDRVDEALEEIEEANKYEQVLAKRAEGISQNLHRALQTHNRYANDDITTALIEHARSSIMYERQLLKELEALRGDVNNAAKKVAPSAAPAPRPTVIPPLEDFSRPPMPRSLAPGPGPVPGINGVHQQTTVRTPPPSNQPIASHNGDPLLAQGPPLQSSPSLHSPVPSSSQFYTHRPLSPSSTQASIVSRLASSSAGPSSPRPPQSPGAGPSSPSLSSEAAASPKQPIDDSPPLGGRFVDGTKSMFVKPSSSTISPLASPPIASSSSSFSSNPSRITGDPLSSHGGPLNRPAERHINNNGLDPLGQARPGYMSASVRVQPMRPRLDAREAASKLANMF
ncbi:Vps5 C terminal like-domain-containing protein [Desarmillaria tabescens]|uniref:Vps5 C terminal like-domain-containing protein n=1 Tax=Armillaria tabescens TaxID=1929756 RepID=A0AA39U0V5_ARMTA|nr:Vps5 C terminal like-domain-containing protein [Desarmillaria tabescens]KAK0468419.1 Vps5 C terminal like-domain-containing protein [Desarmillaria tabescens]